MVFSSTKRLAQAWVRGATSLVLHRSIHSPRLRSILQDLEVSVPPPFEGALFNFTIDFELCFGNAQAAETGGLPLEERLGWARAQAENFYPLVELLERLQFPVSWALLGRLACLDFPLEGKQKFKPAWSREDWYQTAGLPVGRPELWQGKKYLETLHDRLPFCEILSHGYSHLTYSDACVTEEIARADMQVSKKLLEEFGFQVKGFVYPCNEHGLSYLLETCGYPIVRGKDARWRVELPGPNAIHTPIGFWVSPGAMGFGDLKRIIKKAIEKKSFVHPWMHLIECDLRQNDIENFYRPLFELVLEEQDKGKIKNIGFGEMEKILHEYRKMQVGS